MNIVINWSLIGSEAEFYEQVLSQLKAPQWHGHNLDALSDSIGVGSINGVEPPYSISVLGTAHIPQGLLAFSQQVESVLRSAAAARANIALCFSAGQQGIQPAGPASSGSAG